MKVEQQEVPMFRPITITIETRAELTELVATLGSGTGSANLWMRLRDLRDGSTKF